MMDRKLALSLGIRIVVAVSLAYFLFFIVDFNGDISSWTGDQRFGLMLLSSVFLCELTQIERSTGRKLALSLGIRIVVAVSLAYFLFFIVDFNGDISSWTGNQRFGLMLLSSVFLCELTRIERSTGSMVSFVVPFIVLFCSYIISSFVLFDMNICSWRQVSRELFSITSSFVTVVSLLIISFIVDIKSIYKD